MTAQPGRASRIGGRAVAVVLAVVLAVAVAACGGTNPSDDAPAGTLRVVTTTTILADLEAGSGVG